MISLQDFLQTLPIKKSLEIPNRKCCSHHNNSWESDTPHLGHTEALELNTTFQEHQKPHCWAYSGLTAWLWFPFRVESPTNWRTRYKPMMQTRKGREKFRHRLLSSTLLLVPANAQAHRRTTVTPLSLPAHGTCLKQDLRNPGILFQRI